MVKILRVLLVLLPLCAPARASEPIAIVYSLTGEASLNTPGASARPLRLFDRLSGGTIIDVGKGSRVAMAFVNGRRYELGEHSRVTLGPKDLASRSGTVRALPPVPPLPRLLPVAAEDRPGARAGAVRIRAERIAGLLPRRGAATLAGAALFRFDPVEGAGKYGIEVQDTRGNVVFATETTASAVKLPAGALQADQRYHWTVRTLDRIGPAARGEADFMTLPSRLAAKREALRRAVEAAGDGASMALLAEVDRSLGMLFEAREELRAALERSPGNVALAEAISALELQLEDDRAVLPAGVVVVKTAPGSAAERAGLQPGDELAAWSGVNGGSGVLRTPFDLGHVGVEYAPRGTIVLRGSRKGEEKTWHVPPGVWGLEARPALAPDLLALYEQGRQRIAVGDLDAGAALWRSALEALERQILPEPASWLENKLAEAFAAARRWPEADAAWERAARRLEPHRPSGAAQILYRWGSSLNNQRYAYDRAEACGRRALPLVPEGSLAAARILRALGSSARMREDLTAAEDLMRQAHAIHEKLAPESVNLAESLNELAILAGQRGDWAAAKEGFSKALELQQRLAPDGKEVAGTLISLANVFQQQGDFATSNELFRRAIDLFERLDPDDPELARALSRLGHSEMDRGELAIAEERFRRALVIRQKVLPESTWTAASLQNLGLVAEERGDLDAAEEYYRRALEIRERLAPGSSDVAESLAHLGMIERRKGNLAKADESLRRALEIQEKRISPESPNATEIRFQRAQVAVERGDLALAGELYGRLLSLLEERSPGNLIVSDGLQGLGLIALKRGDLPKADELFRRALAIREKLEPGSTRLGMLLNDLGRLHRQAGRLAMAAESFCRATEAFDQQRTKVGGPLEGRSAFGRTTAEHYRDCVAALVDNRQPEEAFRVLERGRARSFLDLLAERDLRWTADLPPELAQERRQVDAEYDRTQAALAGLSPVRAAAEVDRLLVRLRDLRARQEEIVTKVRRIAPRNATLHHPQPLDLAAARSVLDPGTWLVAYSIGRDRSFLFVVAPVSAAGPGLEVFPLSLGDQALRQRVGSFRNLLQRADSDPEALARQARELYDLLLRPADARIATAARILVSPDGPLHTLPFAALVRDGRFLAEQKPIHTILSATVYAELKKSRRAPTPAPGTELAAFGDPSYPPLSPGQTSAAHPDVRAAIGRGLELTPLPATRDEVREIAALFPQARTFLGPEATEESAKSIGQGARYLHFACHGLLDERFPLNSALALSIPAHPGEGQDNGLLQAWEIFESVRLDADLVALSACDSALGSEMGGEGLLGLTRAFQYAGARSVLASLWSVSDVSTAGLMKRFYRHLRAGEAKDEALRTAQIELIRSLEFSHPYHWAAFQLAGDWK